MAISANHPDLVDLDIKAQNREHMNGWCSLAPSGFPLSGFPFKDNMQYLQSNNKVPKVLWNHSWTIELTENEMLGYNKVVHINKTINNIMK